MKKFFTALSKGVDKLLQDLYLVKKTEKPVYSMDTSAPLQNPAVKRSAKKMEDQETEALAPAGKKQGLAGGQGGPVPTTSSAGGAHATPSAVGITGQMTPSTSNAPGGSDPSEIPLPGDDEISGGGAADTPLNEDGSVKLPSEGDLETIIDEMSSDLKIKADGEGNSFSAKLKAPRKVYPYALYILAAETARENLDADHFEGFQLHVFYAKAKLSMDENQKIVIDWMIHQGQYGLAACASKNTALWLKAQAAAFKFNDKATRCFFRWERAETTLYSVFLQGSMWARKTMKPNYVLGKILAANGLQGEFRGVNYDRKHSKGVWMEFEPVTPSLITALNQRTWLNCFTSNPILRKRKRAARTEEEVLRSLAKPEKGPKGAPKNVP